MRGWFVSIYLLILSMPVMANEVVHLPLESGEEVTVNQYSSTFADDGQPILIWFTEGYASRKPFKHLITQFNDAGYDVWQVDLLESYFMQRTPTNVRRMTGEGVAAVLQYASEQDRAFVPISTGRMTLIMLRGARLWQLENAPENGVGQLQQVIAFFPNLFDAPKKAGDAPELFPIVSASSLPITVVQPSEGTYKWKLPAIIDALEIRQSQVTVAAVKDVRDWYFLRRDPNEVEKQAGEAIPDQLETWLTVGKVSPQTSFHPVADFQTREATVSVKGLVSLKPRTAPNFTLTDVNDKAITLQDKRGKVILLNFWASWCPPCVKEIPSMNRLAESFDKDKFEIVSVNFKETPETIAAFLKKVQVDFPVLIDLDGKVSSSYEIFAFPSSFIIDQSGKLRYSVNAAIEWDEPEIQSVIEELVNE